MIILRQSKGLIVTKYDFIWCNDNTIYASDIFLGRYEDNERAMEILKHIYLSIQNGCKAYEMPEE